ncbi:MAG: YfiR family protein, partial [Phycisphaerae bacterium]|nr:YfiR family protein [Phycisphaerae bacterium]
LTISDLVGFAKRGGIIGFVEDNNKIRFEINLDAAQKENIKIRSQLLTLAKEVYETKKYSG